MSLRGPLSLGAFRVVNSILLSQDPRMPAPRLLLITCPACAGVVRRLLGGKARQNVRVRATRAAACLSYVLKLLKRASQLFMPSIHAVIEPFSH